MGIMARSHCPGLGPGCTVHIAPGTGPGNIMRALLICPKNCSISPCAFVFVIL